MEQSVYLVFRNRSISTDDHIRDPETQLLEVFLSVEEADEFIKGYARNRGVGIFKEEGQPALFHIEASQDFPGFEMWIAQKKLDSVRELLQKDLEYFQTFGE